MLHRSRSTKGGSSSGEEGWFGWSCSRCAKHLLTTRGRLPILILGDCSWSPSWGQGRSAVGMLPDALYAPRGVVVDRAEVRDPREVLNMPEVYCVKCKAKREAIDTKKVTMKNGKPALSGICEKCGTKVFKIGG